jgi:hypothetical protein
MDLPATPDALPCLDHEENIDLFERQRVYSGEELRKPV